MDVLITGAGGREHALAWKAAQSPHADTVYVAPGNAGTAAEPGVRNVDLGAGNLDGLCSFARARNIGLTIVGPETPLAAGIVNRFRECGLAVVGPTRAAAQLESSKAFCKDFMRRHKIMCAESRCFDDEKAALDYLRRCTPPLVVKADGLAAGKGVVIAHTPGEAERAVRGMLSGARFGEAGRTVVIEEFLEGEEASFICLADGEHLLPLASSQDHKARDAGDTGPNTGGMGAYSPASIVTGTMRDQVMREVMQPAVAGMKSENTPFTGFLYAGLMIGADGVARVLEFNCRLGDPETQPLLMRLQSDLVELCLLALDGRLNEARIAWDPRPALGVVLAAAGYPGNCEKGHPVSGLERAFGEHTKVFHAGTRMEDGVVKTSGGRVLCVTSLGDDVACAQARAYDACRQINWPGVFCRRDIGHRALSAQTHGQ